MSYSADELKSFEQSAASNSDFVSSVSGKRLSSKKINKIKAASASLFVVFMGAIIAILFSSGNIIPAAISERLVEETDVQYADAVASKQLVFQQAMREGNLPADTKQLLEESGVKVLESESGIALEVDGVIVTADNFITEVNNNIKLYNAFTRATYSRAAYYYDESAQKAFRKIGTNRDNYTSKTEFDSVMDKKVGRGSNINVNSVSLVEKEIKNEKTGEMEKVWVYEENGERASSQSAAGEFIAAVSEKNPASSELEATMFAANAINVADTISKEERSSLFYVTFMENISKMKAGDGNEAQLNAAMNYLYDNEESEVSDVQTGEIVKSYGTALESPSLYAVLADEEIEASAVKNYASDRVLKTVENKVGGSGAMAIPETVTSSSKMNGSIGRFISDGVESASAALLSVLEPTVNSSLMENSFETIKGIEAGEFLVEGAINVGKSLAKESGATGGDAAAVNSYARLNNSVLAMDAQVDRINRSPFDINSRNTFLGSLVYNFAVFSAKSRSGLLGFLNLIKSSAVAILPKTYADEMRGYLTTFGDCETYGTIGVVGSAQCSEIATFDTSTLNNPFGDSGFIAFVEENTVLDESGNRSVIPGSALALFITYNNERETPLGVMDGGILESLIGGGSDIPFLSDILAMVKIFLGASDEDKRIATGAAFVNSASNPDWQTYKYAQRYVSLARATAALRSHSGDSTAYNNIKFFEGQENPVMAFVKEYMATRGR